MDNEQFDYQQQQDEDEQQRSEEMTETNNLELWDKVSQPGTEVLKPIIGGRLGKAKMTDINPMYRYKTMTKQFGICGVGWNYKIIDLWTDEGAGGTKIAWAKVTVTVKGHEPIEGIGGAMMIAKEKEGLHTDDESYKKSVTDALGTAMKMLGVAADVYFGLWDGSKYKDAPKVKVTPKKSKSDNQLVYESMGPEDQDKANTAASRIVDLFACDGNDVEVTSNKELAVDMLFNADNDHKQATFWMLKEQSGIRRYIQDTVEERQKDLELTKAAEQ